MTAQFEPSVEMIEAGAREWLRHDYIPRRSACHCGWEPAEHYEAGSMGGFRAWRAHVMAEILRAALGLVLTEPCPTCEGSGVDGTSDTPWQVACLACSGSGLASSPRLLIGEQVGIVDLLPWPVCEDVPNDQPVFVALSQEETEA